MNTSSKILLLITVVCVVVCVMMWLSLDSAFMVKEGDTYRGFITIHNNYIKMKDNKIIKGKELFYIQPYQGIHFLLSSNGQMLGVDISKEYKIVQNAITQNPIIVKDGKVYAIDLTNKKLMNLSDQIEIHGLFVSIPNNIVENHLRQYIYDLLSSSNFSEIPF